MAYLLGYLAARERFTVESIGDGRKAAERIDAGPAVDLVLLDVMLPYTDGFELLARMRGNPVWKDVPVIILTSKTREHDAVRALSLGADDYLTKPFSPAELVARIRRRLKSVPTHPEPRRTPSARRSPNPRSERTSPAHERHAPSCIVREPLPGRGLDTGRGLRRGETGGRRREPQRRRCARCAGAFLRKGRAPGRSAEQLRHPARARPEQFRLAARQGAGADRARASCRGAAVPRTRTQRRAGLRGHLAGERDRARDARGLRTQRRLPGRSAARLSAIQLARDEARRIERSAPAESRHAPLARGEPRGTLGRPRSLARA